MATGNWWITGSSALQGVLARLKRVCGTALSQRICPANVEAWVTSEVLEKLFPWRHYGSSVYRLNSTSADTTVVLDAA